MHPGIKDTWSRESFVETTRSLRESESACYMQNSLENLSNLSSISPLSNTSNFTPPDHSISTGFPRQRKPTLGEKPKPRQRHGAAAQIAKREILTNVRDDWIWPIPPSHSLVPPRITPSTQWCERFSDSSSPSPSPPPVHSVLEPANPYKYNDPDSIAQPIITRKRKRLQRLKKEMVWNEGLVTYTRRRDAWAGARTTPLECEKPSSAFLTGSSFSPSNKAVISPALSVTHQSASTSPPPPLLPLCPPLISSSNPIRASITPATYPAIYSKVVVQGLTPTVPINLSDVVKALVQGWKEKGEWPPKPEGGLGIERQENHEVKKDIDLIGKSARLRRKGAGKVKRALGLEERQDDEGV